MSKLTVDIGQLDKRITIQHLAIESDVGANESEQWRDYYSCWASVNGVSNREYWRAREQHEENIVNFRVRCCSALKQINKTDYRIVFGGRVYDITFIDDVLFAGSIMNIKGVEHV